MEQSYGTFVIRRLLKTLILLGVISLAVFALMSFGPGDPVSIRTGGKASPETVERIREQLNLNDPFIIRYGKYMVGFFQGNFGESIALHPGFTVKELLVPRLKISVPLGFVSLAIVLLIGMLIGKVSAMKHGRPADPLLIGSALLFTSIPTLIFIPVLLWLFVLKLHVLPVSGWEGVFSTHIVIPLLALVLGGFAGIARIMRVSELSVMHAPYVRMARAKGKPSWRVHTQDITRNSSLPIVTILGLSVAGMLEGSYFVELLYGIPGVGRLTLEAVFARDYDIIMAITMLVAFTFLVAQMLTEIVYTWLDPRIRLEADSRTE